MNHINEDTLLELALGMADQDKEEEIRSHLNDCSECREKYEKIKDDVEKIGGIEFDILGKTYGIPRSGSKIIYSVLKIAAILVAGFIAGYTTSQRSTDTCVNVIPYYHGSNLPEVNTGNLISCESVDISYDLDSY